MRAGGSKGSVPRRRDGRTEMKEFFVMVAMGVPGLGCLVGGFKLASSAHHMTFPGAVLVGVGACLILATGYYHYRKDYHPGEGRGGLVTFLLLTVVPGFIGMLVARLLVRH